MTYSLHHRAEMKSINGIVRQVPMDLWLLDPVEPDVEELAEKLFEVTARHRGSLLVPFGAQPDDIRDYHHDLARTALGRPSARSYKPAAGNDLNELDALAHGHD